jgi:hypothetical protein
MIKWEAVFFLADREINKLMQNCDICPKDLWFGTFHELKAKTSSVPDLDYFKNFMIKSRSHDDFYIPYIEFSHGDIWDDGVISLSDGKRIWVRSQQ